MLSTTAFSSLKFSALWAHEGAFIAISAPKYALDEPRLGSKSGTKRRYCAVFLFTEAVHEIDASLDQSTSLLPKSEDSVLLSFRELLLFRLGR